MGLCSGQGTSTKHLRLLTARKPSRRRGHFHPLMTSSISSNKSMMKFIKGYPSVIPTLPWRRGVKKINYLFIISPRSILNFSKWLRSWKPTINHCSRNSNKMSGSSHKRKTHNHTSSSRNYRPWSRTILKK